MGNTTSNKPPEVAVYSIKVERQKLDRFKAAAEAKNRTVAQQLRHLMDQDIREHEAQAA